MIFLIPLFVAIQMAFTMSEIAMIAMSNQQVEDDARLGKKKAKRVEAYKENPTPYSTTARIVITASLIGSGIVTHALLEGLLEGRGIATDLLVVLLTVLLLLVAHVSLGQIIARRLARKHSRAFGYGLVGIMAFSTYLLRPLVFLITWLAGAIGRIFVLGPSDETYNMTEEDIRMIVEASGKTGVIDEDEREMIHNIFDFDDTEAADIMTHRTEISSLDVRSTKKEIIDFVNRERFTRFPVFEESIDQIVGTLHVKDLLKYLDQSAEHIDLRSILRKPYFIPESKNIRELFKEMQREKNHIAIVIDEYGGTAGLITIEDLLEEIVGNIFDEYDEVEEEFVRIDDRHYEVDGLMNIDDLEDRLGIGLPVDDYDTLSGFILGFLGRIPDNGEGVAFTYNDHRFEVLKYEDQIIANVRITKLEGEKTDD